ncbi:uncharacterized protein TRIVIDRAFT_151149 [Trichoderma virens Gv29-8]|uniref:HIG1 domain-containing protein n=1 Tax=Hypocrea virens (strain Gv29-8 / FGSC 10586) TaxID=413071 RepID=G9MTW6_HYPVG|nr:uncharacterized protein TRIVIDRAFT_151149 [Trichoderma virens Gv29-8]EHK22115.1 hypothetical protein TRIVIDRAFT_151149 [Trichoderma virens Gv29-8]UKZ55873.1 hypothetical protein TrVGV298_009697 [Trichoderma virens]
MIAKVIARSEEQEYYDSIWHAGARTGLIGMSLGLAATTGLHRFYPTFRQLPLYIKSTFAIYPGLIMASIGANEGSHAYRSRLHPEIRKYADESQRVSAEIRARESEGQRAKDWLYEHQLQILGVTWATTMAVCLERMRRDPYTTAAQKIVQARVLAQATTLAILLITAALEAKDKSEGRGKYHRVLLVADEYDEEHAEVPRTT